MTTLYFVLFLVAIGYPAGLKGEAIPLEARIMAMADVFDALVSKQVYKELVPPAHRRGSALGSPSGGAKGLVRSPGSSGAGKQFVGCSA